MTSIVESCSTGKRLLLALCSTALLAFAATGCADSGGSGSGECDEGEQLFQDYPNEGDEGCYQPCDSTADCPSGFECINSTLCAESGGGGTGDVMTGDGGMPDTGTGGNGDDTSNGGNGDDGGGGSGSKSCDEIETCTSKCANDDTDCQSQCVMEGSSDGQSNWQAINDCASMNCGEMSEPTCIQDNCEQELRTCGIVDNATCVDLQVCNTKCLQKIQGENPNADTSTLRQLFRECLAEECPEGSIEGQKQSAEISACRRNNCPTDDDSTAPDCNWQNCQSQYEACKDGEGGNAFGDKSCREVDEAVANCGSQMSSDYECEAKEIWSGTKQARALRDKWQGCLGECFNKFPDNTEETVACIFEQGSGMNSSGETKEYGNCKEFRDQCNEIGTDYQSCSDVLSCLQSGAGDSTCLFDATAEAQKNYFGLLVCGNRNNCGQQQSCYTNNCSAFTEPCGVGQN